MIHTRHPHETRVHWTMAALLALLILLLSGLGWSWVSSGGLERRSDGAELSRPSLPDFKLLGAPRPAG